MPFCFNQAGLTVQLKAPVDLLAEDLILEPFLRDAPASLLPSLLIIENGVDQWQIDLPSLLLKYGYRQIARTRLNLMFELAEPARAA